MEAEPAMYELGTDGPALILVAVDGSETSMRAGAYAAGMARRQGAKIVCVYVGQIAGIAASVPAAVGALIQMHDSIARSLREQIAERAPETGVDVTFVERRGDPYTEIVRLADEMRVDAVVVGRSAQRGHRFMGSLAVRLVRDARWPVTVVP
ncbi:MAG TPA: universal stress protein [Jatrophihabitantaceae bacterium]|jgi:nucleotide-binding universal stress UspA family protein